MALTALSLSQYTEIACYLCRVRFAISDDLYRQRVNDRRTLWCPNGHDQHFTGKTQDQRRIEELQAELAREKQRAESAARARSWAESRATEAERRIRGVSISAGKAKAQLRRTTQRIQAGVCPHCNRTFKQLAAHMKCKHPAV
jgi:hypothetical protein